MTPEHISPKDLKHLNERSDARGCLQAGSHLLALAACTVALLLSWGSWLLLPLFALQGMLLAFLYAGVHELSHRTVFATRRYNEWLGTLFGFLILVPRDFDRYEHFEHHRFTQDPERDTDLVGRPPYTLGSYLLYLSGLSYWYLRFGTLFATALGRIKPGYLTPEQWRQSVYETRTYLIGYSAIAALSACFQSAAALYLWIGPLMAMKWTQLLQNLAEHTGMPYVKETVLNTRTIRTNIFMRWLAWNMPYHTAHHSYPGVPFHALPRLHAMMMNKTGKEPETVSYLGFQWRMLRKLLCDGTSKYVGRSVQTY